jgi:hypothetical protein
MQNGSASAPTLPKRGERVEQVAEDSELKEVYDTERHLLYAACTRAGDFLLVSEAGPASEFLDDMQL